MIKCEKGDVTIKGNSIDVMTELSVIILIIKRNLKRKHFTDSEIKEMIQRSVDTGYLADKLLEEICDE